MPTAPPRVCAHPGCKQTTRGRYCEGHEEQHAKDKPAWSSTTTSASSRGYGAGWRKIRAAILARDPICTGCRRRVSRHVDHIKPKAEGGTDDVSNLRGLCSTCHGLKSSREGAAAAKRKRIARMKLPKDVERLLY